MTEIRRKEMDFLNTEMTGWVEEGIITDSQAVKILSLYEVKKSNLRAILLIAGCVLLGLGLVSFIAAHWHQIDKTIRVILIAAAYTASLTAYIFTGRSETKTGKSFLLLASSIFGAGIYLISHMYDYEMSLTEILGWWIVEIMITAMAARDVWQMYLSQIISLLWLNFTEAINIFALHFFSTAKIPAAEFFAPFRAFLLIIALWILWYAVKDRAAFTFNMMITLCVIASRMSLCFGGTWSLIILAVTGAVMSFIKYNDVEIMGMLMLGLFGLLLTWPDFWRGQDFLQGRNIFPVINAVTVAALMLLNIYRGHSGIGITFCALIAARYFFDHFFGYMPKAWGFTLTGILFVAAGLFFGKIRKFVER